jgi:hypothetical protein
MGLVAVPITFSEACAFVVQHHRHHQPPVGHKFSIACASDDVIVGVAIASRPVARRLDDGWTLEVSRVATDGTRNACSFLYGAVRRAGKAMGYRRFITFTLPEEGGHSLRGAGWECVGDTPGRSWSVPSRPRVDKHPLQTKLRWEG